jgi:hypothetical protein
MFSLLHLQHQQQQQHRLQQTEALQNLERMLWVGGVAVLALVAAEMRRGLRSNRHAEAVEQEELTPILPRHLR